MTHDPEAAWPLTQPEQGYYPGTPSQPLAPSNMMPAAPQYRPVVPSQPARPMPWWVRVTMLAILMAAAIPITVVALVKGAFISLIVAWAGIVLVSAFFFGFTQRNQ